jgi:C4-dicarboxylate-specific signal transduction histidine kinase
VESGVEELRKKDELMLQQTKLAQLGEMIAMIAHQWRQPLSSISAISANIQLSIALDEEIKKEHLKQELNTIDKRITLLSNTIDDFRNFYNTNHKKKEFDLSHTIHQAIEVLTPAIENAEVTLEFKNSLTSRVTSLESELIQVLMNIIKNAIDILNEQDIERKITVMAYQDSEHTYIVIEDNAGGVADKIIDKIFNPYFSTKKEKHGMGLGLYMSKLIIQEHCDGTLDVHNTDKGAVFTITLPLQS